MSIDIPILCFNDVYRVNQRYVPQPGAPSEIDKSKNQHKGGNDGETISVSQFGQLVLDIRELWGKTSRSDKREKDDEREGLMLFAGDVFNPSVESSVTRGSHMVGVFPFTPVAFQPSGENET